MGMQVGNRSRCWSQYNQSLIARGDIRVWIDEDTLSQWKHDNVLPKNGRPYLYSDTAIQCFLVFKILFSLPLRATQGLMQSILDLMDAGLTAPCYTTICRRQRALEIDLKGSNTLNSERTGPCDLVIDSTGLKIYGEGEWKVRTHGASKRRTWRKIHLAVDPETFIIKAAVVTTNDVADGEVLTDLLDQVEEPINAVAADGAYDTVACYDSIRKRRAEAVIPPRQNAKIIQHGNSKKPSLNRDDNLRKIRQVGAKRWKQDTGYHQRSLAETTMYRLKQLLGPKLSARLFESQAVEAFIRCAILNDMLRIKVAA
jgi:transposase